MNRIILGSIVAALLVTAMLAFAQDQKMVVEKPGRIGSDPFFGLDPEMIRKNTVAPPPAKGVRGAGSSPSSTKNPENVPGTPPDMNPNVGGMEPPPGTTSTPPTNNQPTPKRPEQEQLPSDEYYRGY